MDCVERINTLRGRLLAFRGLSEVYGAVIVAVVTVFSLAALSVALQRASTGMHVVELMQKQLDPPAMELKALTVCFNGSLKAEIIVYSGSLELRPTMLEVVATNGTLVSSWRFNGSKAFFSLPCTGSYVLVIHYRYGVWVYSYRFDPLHNCYSGRIVDAGRVLDTCRAYGSPENIRKLIDIVSSAVKLKITWVHGPLKAGFPPSEAALAGVVPGYNVPKEAVVFDLLSENTIRSKRSVLVELSALGRSSARETLYYTNATYTDTGWLQLRDYEAVLDVSLGRNGRVLKANYTLTKNGLLCICSGVYGLYNYGYGEYVGPGAVLYHTNVEAAGAVGSIYIPFMVSSHTNTTRVAAVTIIPAFNARYIVEYEDPIAVVMGYTSCPPIDEIKSFGAKYEGELAQKLYIAVKLHVIPFYAYDPTRIIVQANYTTKVPIEWQSRIVTPARTILVFGPKPLEKPVTIAFKLPPPEAIDSKWRYSIVVLEVSYAANWSGWAPYTFASIDPPAVASLGANIMLHVALSGVEGEAWGTIVSPSPLKPSSSSFGVRLNLWSPEKVKLIKGCTGLYELHTMLEPSKSNLTLYIVNGTYTLEPAVKVELNGIKTLTLDELARKNAVVDIFNYYFRRGASILVLDKEG